MTAHISVRVEGETMSINANDLILFAYIMEAGSFSKAAERTNLPKSTLSRRITELETALGERLITRSTRQLVITDFGEGILEYALRLLEENDAAAAFALNRQATPQGKLRVSMPPELKEFSFVEFTKRFLDAYPEVDLELDLSARRVDILAERFDLAIRVASRLPDDASLVARKIAVLNNGLYASPAYIKKHGELKTPNDLIDAHCLSLRNSQGEQRVWQLNSGSENWHGLPKHRVSSNSVSLNLSLTLEGMGIMGVSDLFACEFVRRGELIRVLPEWCLPSDTVWCVTSGRRLLPTRTQAFIDMFRETLQAKAEDL